MYRELHNCLVMASESSYNLRMRFLVRQLLRKRLLKVTSIVS